MFADSLGCTEKIQAAFDHFDADQSGDIRKDEFLAAMVRALANAYSVSARLARPLSLSLACPDFNLDLLGALYSREV